LPYLKYKLEATVNAQRGTALQAALWGRGDPEDVDDVAVEPARVVEVVNSGQEGSRSVAGRFKQLVIQAVVKCYPWVHAATEGVKMTYL